MADIHNPGVTPTPGTPEYGRDKPRLGEGEEAQEPKPFSLGPEGEVPEAEKTATEQPSPLDMAREAAQQHKQMSPEELTGHIQSLKTQLAEANTKIQDPNITNQFTPDHEEALRRLTEKMNPDMRSIAKNSEGEFNPPQHTRGENVLKFVTSWINGSQSTLTNALNYLSTQKKPNIASYLKLQYSVQRATQRGELFASIVGASVSGIKTIMSLQLG